MFHHYSDVLDNKLQLAIGIVGIISGLCFHLLPRLPKIISIANHKTNPTVTELDSATNIYVTTCFCYVTPALYAALFTSDPLFLAFNSTGFVISFAYLIITTCLPQDKLVRDPSGDKISLLYWVVLCAVIGFSFSNSRTLHGVGAIAFLVVVCVVKLWFETKDVGPVWALASSLVMILNGAIWVAYGVLVKDVFICVSSGIGCVAGVAGLVVLCVKKYRNNYSTVAPVGGNGDGIV